MKYTAKKKYICEIFERISNGYTEEPEVFKVAFNAFKKLNIDELEAIDTMVINSKKYGVQM